MPLIVVCGIPCSGKSYISQKLETYFKEKNVNVVVVRENEIVSDPNSDYNSANREKEIRSTLKSSVQRHLTKDTVVILDALNYIKGFRYELYCLAKELKSTSCVIECVCSLEEAVERNKNNFYSDKILKELFNRYETANSQNRWDSPLFVVTSEIDLCADAVHDALFARKAPTPNQATQSQPLSETNFLYELNEKTKDIVNHILKTQSVGDIYEISVPHSPLKLSLKRTLTSGELNKFRRQFITYTKQHPTKDANVIPTLFIQYLNGIVE